MADFKLCITDPKSGKTYQKGVKDQEAAPLIGKIIGETITGDSFGMSGYEFQITGGSDKCGFPMRKGIKGVRKKLTLLGGVGLRKNFSRGIKKRKTVCGQKIIPGITQINLKLTKEGTKKLSEMIGHGEEKEEKKEKAKAPKEVKKEKTPKKEKPPKEKPEKVKKEETEEKKENTEEAKKEEVKEKAEEETQKPAEEAHKEEKVKEETPEEKKKEEPEKEEVKEVETEKPKKEEAEEKVKEETQKPAEEAHKEEPK